MNQLSEEPEFTLECPSAKMLHSIAQSKDTRLDLQEVEVELLLLSAQALSLVDISRKIAIDMAKLAASLQDTV